MPDKNMTATCTKCGKTLEVRHLCPKCDRKPYVEDKHLASHTDLTDEELLGLTQFVTAPLDGNLILARYRAVASAAVSAYRAHLADEVDIETADEIAAIIEGQGNALGKATSILVILQAKKEHLASQTDEEMLLTEDEQEESHSKAIREYLDWEKQHRYLSTHERVAMQGKIYWMADCKAQLAKVLPILQARLEQAECAAYDIGMADGVAEAARANSRLKEAVEQARQEELGILVTRILALNDGYLDTDLGDKRFRQMVVSEALEKGQAPKGKE